MPVEDHEVHEKVKISADKRYGCWGKEVQLRKGYWAPDRKYSYDGTFTPRFVFIEHVMTTDCAYDRHQTDPRCTGCPAIKRFA